MWIFSVFRVEFKRRTEMIRAPKFIFSAPISDFGALMLEAQERIPSFLSVVKSRERWPDLEAAKPS
jgi:hypothetical protein